MDSGANLVDLLFGYIFFVLLSCFAVEAVKIRAMERTAVSAATPVPAAAHQLSMETSW